ncbi:MAG: peptide ABC transporter substrate-binding protein [Treponema sp.]|jgi:peptide/nickel transport system substrate-binding protein/oligopeptide transport system substrate-binding protein|nr:peptide ABC transporter substrate-binding protein [Treponema sp.]
MKKPALIRLALYFLTICVLVVSCKALPSSKTPQSDMQAEEYSEETALSEIPVQSANNYAETRPRVKIRDELTVTFSSGDIELDFRKSYLAVEAQIFTGIYEGLFSYDPLTLEPHTAAARSFKLSDDKKEWTFTLRRSAKYWNGDTVRAEDFRQAWLSQLDPERDSPYSSLFDIIEGAKDFRLGMNLDLDSVGIEAQDDRTLIVRLNAPAAFFPSMLCHHSFSPIHPSMLNEEAWKNKQPVSNGPFRITEYGKELILLEKNSHYWDAEDVALKKIFLKFTADGDESASLWNSGESRWIAGEVNMDALTDMSGIKANAIFATHYYFIRSEKKPWNDHRIRRALSLVIPWDEVRRGHYLPAKTLIFPIPGYPEIEGLETSNVEEARSLFEQAGFPKGAGLPELVIRITPSQNADHIARLFAASWMEYLGVPVKIDVVPFNRYFQSLKESNYDVGSTTWIGDFADPYTFLQMWRRDSNLNDACYNDEDYEALMERSMTEEGSKRWETLAEAEQLLLSRGTVLPISFSPAINIVDTDEIGGWYTNVLDIHPFKYLSFKALRPLPGVAALRHNLLFTF